MLDVEVTTREGRQPLPKAAIVALVRTALRRVGIRHASVSIAFVSDVVMRRLNRSYRKRDAVTDVLSFAPDRMIHTHTQELGDVVLAPEVLKTRASGDRNKEREEAIRLLSHGLLHLLGYDHATSVQERRMFAFQERVVRDLCDASLKDI